MVGVVEAQPITPWFSWAGRELAHACARLGLVAPSFRSPPAVAGVDRTLGWRPHGGGPVVAVRLWGRSFADIGVDMVEGVLAANGLVGSSSSGAAVRARLEEVMPLPQGSQVA